MRNLLALLAFLLCGPATAQFFVPPINLITSGGTRAIATGCIDNAGSGNVQTYTGASIGAAAVDRGVAVVTMGVANNRTITSATYDGNAASVLVQSNDAGGGIFNDVELGIIYLAYPTGTTSDIVITWTGAMDGTSICVYALYGLISGTPDGTATGTSTGSGNNPASTITVAANSILIAGYGASDTAYVGNPANLGPVAWTGIANEDTDHIQVNPTGTAFRVSAAYESGLGSQSNRPITAVSSGPATAGTQSIIAATWH